MSMFDKLFSVDGEPFEEIEDNNCNEDILTKKVYKVRERLKVFRKTKRALNNKKKKMSTDSTAI